MSEQMITDYDVKITKKNFTSIFKTSDIIQFNESHDGINFQLKNGVRVTFEDAFMPLAVKIKIKSVLDKFKNANININMDNYNNPVSVYS